MNTVATPLDRFGPQLRSWRHQRRLSQLALATEAEVSQRHVSFLESGRAHPSREMVLMLADALDMPLRDRNHFLAAAGFGPVYSYRGLDDADMTPVRKALDLLLTHHEPFPAFVIDRMWNLVTTNGAMTRLLSVFGDVDSLWETTCPQAPPNLMKLTFHPEGMRPFIANFDVLGPALINRCHREADAHPQLRPVLAEILSYPGTPTRWRSLDYSIPNEPLLTMDLRFGELRCRLFSTITTFGTPQDVTTDELRVESIFPADETSEQLMRRLADG